MFISTEDKMQRNSIITLFIALFFLVSCSSSHSSNDSDIIPDTDSDDTETIADDDTDSEEDFDFIDDSEEKSDQDSDSDSVTDADSDEDVACLDLRYNENTIKTPFPFKDANGKPTFCRPGCDTPTENDPQCVRNIWEWNNWQDYLRYLEAQEKDPNQTKERECYPWPCVLPDMHAKTKAELNTFISSCDRLLTVNGFDVGMGTEWSNGMYDGIVGIFMNSGRAIEYDPEKDEYKTIGMARYLGFNENRYVMDVFDQYPGKVNGTNRSFIVSVFRKNNEYYYEFIYDNKTHNANLSRPPLVGKNWVLMHVQAAYEGREEIKYASSKDWEWHELAGINNYAGEGNIVGDHLTFITNNRELYYCDLRKYPKHIDECFKLNRKDDSGNEELGHSPRIDLENEYRVVYNVYRKQIFVEVDLHDLKNPKYTEYKIENSKETTYSQEIDMLQGNKISYQEFFTLSGGTSDVIGCFYRFDKQKTYCPAEPTFNTHGDELMGHNVFWGKWHLWKRITRPTTIIRDLECYCEETGVCPLEE